MRVSRYKYCMPRCGCPELWAHYEHLPSRNAIAVCLPLPVCLLTHTHLPLGQLHWSLGCQEEHDDAISYYLCFSCPSCYLTFSSANYVWQRDRQKGKQTKPQAGRERSNQMERWSVTDRPTDSQTDRQTARQTDMSVCLSNYLSGCLSESRDRQREGLMCLPKPPVH